MVHLSRGRGGWWRLPRFHRLGRLCVADPCSDGRAEDSSYSSFHSTSCSSFYVTFFDPICTILSTYPPICHQVSAYGSGAPVLAAADMPSGTPVMRGPGWNWGGQDGRPFAVGSAMPGAERLERGEEPAPAGAGASMLQIFLDLPGRRGARGPLLVGLADPGLTKGAGAPVHTQQYTPAARPSARPRKPHAHPLAHHARPGCVGVAWAVGDAAWYSAGNSVYDLAHAARPGAPVTVYNAREGLRVTPGRDWAAAPAATTGARGRRGRGAGVLVRPLTADGCGAIFWLVDWGGGEKDAAWVGGHLGPHELVVSDLGLVILRSCDL